MVVQTGAERLTNYFSAALSLQLLDMRLQAEQVRKSRYVPEFCVDYHPDKYQSCTVYAGTVVQQVCPLSY